MDGYMGSIMQFGGNFPPKDWAYCYGQSMSIAEFSALYSLLGTFYGGDGRVSFNVPDLRGRTAVGAGSGPGLTPLPVGYMGGLEFIRLTQAEMPTHTHATSVTPPTVTATAHAKNGAGDQNDAGNGFWASGSTSSGKTVLNVNNGYSSSSDATLAPGAVSVDVQPGGVTVGDAGGNQQFPIRSPFTAIHSVICVSGLYPSRN